ncbi:hypothetical protein [Clostridium ljungdahlii]|uniref:hypothetical protein n=1 Tax=Clostridium ljungdahlii TaxID=1538 RepID=UPI000A6BB3A8|nr:hypothetical protein [Clostridium ljungdahlii]
MGNRGLSLAGINVVSSIASLLPGTNQSLAASAANSTKAILKDGSSGSKYDCRWKWVYT